jgi:hypothetical protein
MCRRRSRWFFAAKAVPLMFWVGAILLSCLLSLSACSSRPAADDLPELPKTTEDCERYLQVYAKCLHGLGSSDAVVKQRVRAAHQTFVGGEEAALNARCKAASAQMAASCK